MANRGTKKSKPSKETPIVGQDFKKAEEKRLDESGIEYISSGRGTSKIPVEKTKTESKPEYKGKKTSNRGTSSQ
jgi:hypothetical protein